MPESISYNKWLSMVNSDSEFRKSQSVFVHVTLYDADGCTQTIRGEMVERKLASGLFFSSDPTATTAPEATIEVDPEPEVSFGAKPVTKVVSTLRKKRS